MLREELKNAMKTAMKEKNQTELSTVRLINAAIKDRDIASRGKGDDVEVSDADIMKLLQTMIKQRKDSIDMYTKGNRPELADKEQVEIDIIEKFLPKQMSEEEIAKAVEEAIKATGAESIKDMGKLMGFMRGKYAGSMDFGKASNIIKNALAG